MTATAVHPEATHHLRTVSLLEAGALLGIRRTQTYKLRQTGDFPVPILQIAGHLRVRIVDLEAYLEDPTICA